MSNDELEAGPSAFLAFVRSSKETGDSRIKIGAEGHILWATGEFLRELNEHGSWQIADHEIEPPGNLVGLLVYEGFIEVGYGEDPDVEWRGSWRQLSHWELLRVRFGKPPWGEHTPLETEQAK